MSRHGSVARQFEGLVSELREQAWEVEEVSEFRWCAKAPGGGMVYLTVGSAPHAFENAVAGCKRLGFKPPSREKPPVPPLSNVRSIVVPPPLDEDAAFAKLKEARALYELSCEEWEKAADAASAAQSRLEAAGKEKENAARELATCKHAFDRLFETAERKNP